MFGTMDPLCFGASFVFPLVLPSLYCVVGNLFNIQDPSLCQNLKKLFLATPDPLTW